MSTSGFMQTHRLTNNGFLPLPTYGKNLGLQWEEPKQNRHLPPSQIALNVHNKKGYPNQYQCIGYAQNGKPIWQQLY